MKRALGVLLGVAMLIMVTGCGGQEREYRIEVRGTAGLEFGGSIGGISGGIQVTSRSVSGRVPADFKFTGSLISVVFQKMQDRGTLEVRILVAGRTIASETTSAPYGIVSIVK